MDIRSVRLFLLDEVFHPALFPGQAIFIPEGIMR